MDPMLAGSVMQAANGRYKREVEMACSVPGCKVCLLLHGRVHARQLWPLEPLVRRDVAPLESSWQQVLLALRLGAELLSFGAHPR